MSAGFHKIFEIRRSHIEELGVDLEKLQLEEISILEEITKGEVKSSKLPERLIYAIDGYSHCYDFKKAVAAEALQAIDLKKSYEPIMNWLKHLSENKEERHWAHCQQIFDRIEIFADINGYRQKMISDSIPLLVEFGKDYYVDDWKKRYPERAMCIIANLGGEMAIEALTDLQTHSRKDSGKLYAKILLENIKHSP